MHATDKVPEGKACDRRKLEANLQAWEQFFAQIGRSEVRTEIEYDYEQLRGATAVAKLRLAFTHKM